MKSFGIRLALGLSLILLAAIMAGQAQKNRQVNASSAWEVPETEGEIPAPIGTPDGQDWPSTEPVPTDNKNPFDLQQAVQLVQHTEPAEPQKQETPAMTFQIPPDETPTFADAPKVGNDSAKPVGSTMSLSALALPPAENAPQPEPTAPAATLALPDSLPTAEIAAPAASPAQANMGFDINSLPGANALRQGADSAMSNAPGPAKATLGINPLEVNTPLQDQKAAQTQPIDTPAPMVRPVQIPNQFAAAPEQPAAAQPQPMQSQIQIDNSAALRLLPQNSATAQNQTTPPMSAPPMGAPSIAGTANGMTPEIAIAPQAEITQQNPPLAQQQIVPPQQPSVTFPAQDRSFNQPASNYGPQLGATTAPPASGQSLPANPYGQPTGNLPQPNTAPAPTQFNAGPASPIGKAASATMASPGDRRFDGVQSPSIVIHKRAPQEVKVGRPASFAIHVQNVGAAEAMDVRIHDRVPAGMRLLDASPAPVRQGDMLMWQIGAMRPGDERTVTMHLEPIKEGELGSVARVTFEAAASVRTISTRPQLRIVQNAPEKVLIGQQLEIELVVSNPGTGTATGVVLQEDVPEGLEHPKGRQLDNSLGALRPGEERHQVLRLRAVEPGVVQNTIRLMGDDGLQVEDTVAVEVIAPNLQVALQGPSKRFLERPATFSLDLANTGTADATNVEIAAYLDRGFTFVSTENQGQYDPSQHAVFWSLQNLPRNGEGKVPLTLLPVQEGERAIRLEAKADLGVVAKSQRSVSVDSLAELTFQINDTADPIEIGGETTYEIKLTNTGSRKDSNVRVQLQLPTGIELLSSDADAETDGRGLVAFAPQRQLAANGELVYRVKVRGASQGTHLVKAVVISDQSKVPVTKEESTMVYADQ